MTTCHYTLFTLGAGKSGLSIYTTQRDAAPGQIVPVLADRGHYIGSERRFYRVLHCHGQANRRARARQLQEPRPVPRLRADGPNQVWSCDITYLPTTVRGIWLYLYLGGC